MADKRRISMAWSDDLDELVEQVVKDHAAEILAVGIAPYTNTTHTGEVKANTAGVFRWLLMEATKKPADG